MLYIYSFYRFGIKIVNAIDDTQSIIDYAASVVWLSPPILQTCV